MIRDFGRTSDGQPVESITIRAGKLTATFLDRGSILQDLRLGGAGHSLTLGSDRIADYEGAMRYHGALVGPVANRIAGAAAVIAGRPCRFEANEGGACLHSGPSGIHARRWRREAAGEDTLTLVLDLADGEGGFPGNRRITALWRVAPPATLLLRLVVTTDADTLVNVANHSYWNLDGTPGWSGHRLRIAADHITETDAALIPTGRLLPVAGTGYDLRQGRRLVPGEPPLDTNFCLSMAPQPLRDVLWLTGRSGVEMVIATNAPGMQVYDGRAAQRPGGSGYDGLALEPQFWPDAPHHPGFPSILLKAGETRVQETRWRFGT